MEYERRPHAVAEGRRQGLKTARRAHPGAARSAGALSGAHIRFIGAAPCVAPMRFCFRMQSPIWLAPPVCRSITVQHRARRLLLCINPLLALRYATDSRLTCLAVSF